MKKLLILVVIALIGTLVVITIINGLQIGGFQVLGITQVKEQSLKLDESVQQATKVASTDFPKAVSSLSDNIKKLQNEKQTYEDMVTVSTDEQVQTATQFYKYEIESLWVKIGKHATSEGVVPEMQIVKGNSNTQDTYNLNFTVTGSYIGITDFITDIEDDSTLGFKIEEFKMLPEGGNDNLKATFVCKDITIVNISTTTSTQNTDQLTGEEGTNTTSGNTTTGTNTTANTTTGGNTTTNSTSTNTAK